MNKIVLSPEAREDLLEIRQYITDELENPDAALRTVASITQKLRMLEARAEIGARLSSIAAVDSDYLYLVCGHYIAFYRYVPQTVYVDRILYYRRDLIRALFEDPSCQ